MSEPSNGDPAEDGQPSALEPNYESPEEVISEDGPIDIPGTMGALMAHVGGWKDAQAIMREEADAVNRLRAILSAHGVSIALTDFDTADQVTRVGSVAPIVSVLPQDDEVEPEDLEGPEDLSGPVAQQDTRSAVAIRTEALAPGAAPTRADEAYWQNTQSRFGRAVNVGMANAEKIAERGG